MDLLPSARAAEWRHLAEKAADDGKMLAAAHFLAQALTWEPCAACRTRPRSLDLTRGRPVVVCPSCGREAGK